MQNNKIRILIVDDHPLVREGLRAVLGSEDDLDVVGEAENGLVATRQSASLNPDIILMDLLMPELNGGDATRAILAQSPDRKVIILTSVDDIEILRSAIKAGALGYVSKNASPGELVVAIRAVHAGGIVLPTQIAKALLHDSQPPNPHPAQAQQLTVREQEVLEMTCRGLGNVDIGRQLFISHRTVSVHVSRILEKLGVQNRTQLVLYALRTGLVAEKKPNKEY